LRFIAGFLSLRVLAAGGRQPRLRGFNRRSVDAAGQRSRRERSAPGKAAGANRHQAVTVPKAFAGRIPRGGARPPVRHHDRSGPRARPPTLADVDSPTAVAAYQALKRAHRQAWDAIRAGERDRLE
jgi:hypothetical protein